VRQLGTNKILNNLKMLSGPLCWLASRRHQLAQRFAPARVCGCFLGLGRLLKGQSSANRIKANGAKDLFAEEVASAIDLPTARFNNKIG